MNKIFTVGSGLAIFILLLWEANLYANVEKKMQNSLSEVKALRQEIQRKTLPLLVLLKGLDETASSGTQQRVKIITPIASIRESDLAESRTLLLARRNDEFPIVSQNDPWYKIRLRDGREGWIHNDVVQEVSLTTVVESKGEPHHTSQEIQEKLAYAEEMVMVINAKKDSVDEMIASAKTAYEQLTASNRRNFLSIYQDIVAEEQKIKEYAVYANHFYGKYAHLRQPGGLRTTTLLDKMSGQASLQMGKSTFESQSEESLTSRDFNLSSIMRLSDQSQLSAAYNNRSEVIQTAYSSNELQVGYAFRSPGGLRYTVFGQFNNYDDQNLDRNDFDQYSAGANLQYPLSRNAHFLGDVRYIDKNYQAEGSNEFSGIRFNTGLRFRSNPKSQIDLRLRGNLQSSQISYLEFNRIIPQFQYLRRGENGSFITKLEFETIGYGEEAQGNNFSRERIDLIWSRDSGQRQIFFIGKQYPNNKRLSHLKFGTQLRGHSADRSGFSRSGLSLLYVYFMEFRDSQIDYFDLRADRSKNGEKTVFDLGLFSRIWSKSDTANVRDHIIDAYARLGWKISWLTIGPLAGAHLLVRKNEQFLKRDGNSLRAGVDAQGNFFINTATLSFSARYEYNFVYGQKISIDPQTGETTEGDVVTRNPTNLQISAAFRVPLRPALDFNMELSTYNIKLDVDEETSINPVDSRSRLMIHGGLNYRFGR